MLLTAQGFLLLTVAFSSALTFSPGMSAQAKSARPASKSTSGNRTGTQPPGTRDLTTLHVDHDLEKRSAEILPRSMTAEEDNRQLLDEGKRAKKEYSRDDYCAGAWRARVEGALRKRFFSDAGEMMGAKRASMSFEGMRGKKSRGNEGWAGDASQAEGVGVVGAVEGGEYSDERRWEEGSGEGLRKRSPYAFQGMRGKKEFEYDLKRAMGFLGMRGKKGTDVGEYKRAPQTSFFGMKGKKAQSSGFFGMRGKKGSPNAFFGIKGKRYDGQDLSLLDEFKEAEASSNRFRRGVTWLNNSKKAKSSFFGIRGKKTSAERPRYGLTRSLSEASVGRTHEEMRLRFCGDLDCPDWVLAEMNTLSKMSSVKVKALCAIAARALTGNELDEEKAKKLVLDSKLGADDMNACVVALSLILTSSARYAVEEDVLNNELQQVGLPKEHATALCRVYSDYSTLLTQDLEKRSLRTSSLQDVSCSVRNLEGEDVEMTLRVKDESRNVTSTDVITMTAEQLNLLLRDMETVREEMENLPD